MRRFLETICEQWSHERLCFGAVGGILCSMDTEQAALTIRVLADSRKTQESQPRPQLVWSDSDLRGTRDTWAVAQELFRSAQKHVLISTYNVGHKRKGSGEPGHPLLRPLAERMEKLPKLRVWLFFHLRRMPWRFHAGSGHGRLRALVSNGVVALARPASVVF